MDKTGSKIVSKQGQDNVKTGLNYQQVVKQEQKGSKMGQNRVKTGSK